jgi:hypothetical protein
MRSQYDRNPFLTLLLCAFYLIFFNPLRTWAQDEGYLNRITFINGTGEEALVKLVGPLNFKVPVPDNRSATVNVAPGSYYILVRYGSSGHYSYSKGDPFNVEQIGNRYSVIHITLHKVLNGNYHSRDSSQNEFNSH